MQEFVSFSKASSGAAVCIMQSAVVAPQCSIRSILPLARQKYWEQSLRVEPKIPTLCISKTL